MLVESEEDEQIVDNKEQGGIRLHSVRAFRRCIQAPGEAYREMITTPL